MDIEDRLSPKLYQVLATAIELTGADKGNIQFYYEREKTLRIVAHIGFSDGFLRVFETVAPGHAVCGIALERRERIVVEDTSKHPAFDSLGSTAERFGFSAVQSTPLFDEKGNFFGIISTHFKETGGPSPHELKALDDYLRRAAPLLSRKRREYKAG